jgi:hypothetical protein
MSANESEPLEPLAPAQPGSRLETEWNFYRTQRDRLIAEGHENRYVLIKGTEVLGIFETWGEAREAGRDRIGHVDMLVHQVVRKERVLKFGYGRLECPTLRSRCNPTG